VLGYIKKYLRKKKFGDPVILVSGLPRSGTSMMMKMLEAGGLPVMIDQIRIPDEDNPKGYYEYERVKELDKEGQSKEWIKEARGKVIKIISFLLPELPNENYYQIIFMHRNLDEVLASQNKMLKNRGEGNEAGADDEQMKKNYEKHVRKIQVFILNRPNMEVLNVNYHHALDDPQGCANTIKKFLGLRINIRGMGNAVDKTLYRNRKDLNSL
jgi:hypothetical protein